MQLKNDLNGRNALQFLIIDHYEKSGRTVRYFFESKNDEWDCLYLYFLVSKKYVIRYGIDFDKGSWLSRVELGIGPHYFGPADFWSHKDSERFHISTDPESIIHNLKLLDEFFDMSTEPSLTHNSIHF